MEGNQLNKPKNLDEIEKVDRLVKVCKEFDGDFCLYAVLVMAAFPPRTSQEKVTKYLDGVKAIRELNFHGDESNEAIAKFDSLFKKRVLSEIHGLKMTVPDFVRALEDFLRQELPIARKLNELDKEIETDRTFGDSEVPSKIYDGGLPGNFAKVITEDLLYISLLGAFLAVKDKPEVPLVEKLDILKDADEFARSFRSQINLLIKNDMPELSLSEDKYTMRGVSTHCINTAIEVKIINEIDKFRRELKETNNKEPLRP